MSQFTDFASVEEYLDRIPKFQSKGASSADFNLDRFREFCDAIGNPQLQFPAVHVAGTNGKGSTCRMLASAFHTAGYRVGTYTSPHILDFKERFQINDNLISGEELASFFDEYVQQIEQYKLTYFEISTAIAFWWFARSNVDIAVLETGLGGRLDATNVVQSKVSVITSVSLDHTDILGDTIEEIAREKGGIIKQNQPVVIGDLPQTARTEIQKIADAKGSEITAIDDLEPTFVKPGHYQLRINGSTCDINSNLSAPVQAKNMAITWKVLEQMKDDFPVSKEEFADSLNQINIGHGRFEKLLENKRWYFDGGHNVEAVQAMKESLKSVGRLDKAVLILSLMKDKLRPQLVNEFSEFKNIYYYQLSLERAATFDDINQWLPHVNPFPEQQNLPSFLDDLDSELVIFSGSFYFYEAVRDRVLTYC